MGLPSPTPRPVSDNRRPGISLDDRTDLYVFARGGIMAARYRNDILEPIARPYGQGEQFLASSNVGGEPHE